VAEGPPEGGTSAKPMKTKGSVHKCKFLSGNIEETRE